MASEITIPVGSLYENLHVQFSENIGEEYDAQLRQEVENFLHRYNQQLSRQVEQQENQMDEEE